MKKKLFFTAIIVFSLTSVTGQNQLETATLPKLESNTITVSSTASGSYSPDSYTIEVTLSEFISVDPGTQQTTTISIEEIEKTFYEKMNPFGIKKTDVALKRIYETNPQINNYGVYTNVTQKRTIKKTVSFTIKDKELIQQVVLACRFNGAENVLINANYASGPPEDLIDTLISEALTQCQKKASLMATKSNVTLGKVKSMLHTDSFATNSAIIQPYNYNYYANAYANFAEQLASLTLTVCFELVED